MTPRFPDADVPALRAELRRVQQALGRTADLHDPRNKDVFLRRASLRYAVGDPPEGVVDDLRSAGLCVRQRAGILLHTLPPQRLKSRRIEPLELALLHPDPDAVENVAQAFGLPLVNVYADAASHALRTEVDALSSWFSSRRFDGAASIAGLTAASYASALAAVATDQEREATTVLRLMDEALDTVDQDPGPAVRGYLARCAVLADIVSRRTESLGPSLAALAECTPASPQSGPNASLPALVGLAALVRLQPDLEPLAAQDPGQAALCAVVLRRWADVE